MFWKLHHKFSWKWWSYYFTKQSKKRRKKVKLVLDELQLNDYVVHEKHGIGQV